VRLPPALLQLQLQEMPEDKTGCVTIAMAGSGLMNQPSKILITRREVEILHHLCNGESAKETARVLGICYRTVENHWENIRHKSGATNCVTLALWAVKTGIVKL